jgi:hypothetical protein
MWQHMGGAGSVYLFLLRSIITRNLPVQIVRVIWQTITLIIIPFHAAFQGFFVLAYLEPYW